MNTNPLQNLKPEELIYIQSNSPVGSQLWTQASSLLAALQQSFVLGEEIRKRNTNTRK